MNNIAKSYLATVLLAGAGVITYALSQWRSNDLTSFSVFLPLFLAAATLKCRLPGISGTYSPVFFFALLGSLIMPFSQVVIASAMAGVVQCAFKRDGSPTFIQICFNAMNLSLSTASAFVFVQRWVPGLAAQPKTLCFILGASIFYLVNTGLVSLVLTLVEGGSVSGTWKNWCLGSLPYYAFGTVIAGVALSASKVITLPMILLIAPAILLATLSYRMWIRSSASISAR